VIVATRAGRLQILCARVIHAPGFKFIYFSFFFAWNTETGRNDPRFDPDGSLFTGDKKITILTWF
jgi:hypothetical protein